MTGWQQSSTYSRKMPLTHIDLSTFCFKIYFRQESNPKVTVRAKLALAARPGPSQSIWKWSGRRDHRVLKVQDWGEDETGEDSLSLGGLRDRPSEFFWILSALCAFLMLSLSNWWVWNFGPDFNRFGHKLSLEKIFFDARETVLDKIFFRQPRFCMLLWHYFTYMSRQVLPLALTWWHFKD